MIYHDAQPRHLGGQLSQSNQVGTAHDDIQRAPHRDVHGDAVHLPGAGNSLLNSALARKQQGLRRDPPEPLAFVVVEARNHLQANRSLGFRFEVNGLSPSSPDTTFVAPTGGPAVLARASPGHAELLHQTPAPF